MGISYYASKGKSVQGWVVHDQIIVDSEIRQSEFYKWFS